MDVSEFREKASRACMCWMHDYDAAAGLEIGGSEL